MGREGVRPLAEGELRAVEVSADFSSSAGAGEGALSDPAAGTVTGVGGGLTGVATGAEAVVTANPGCIIQIVQGLEAAGAPVKVLHLVELLDESYRNVAVRAERRSPEARA